MLLKRTVGEKHTFAFKLKFWITLSPHWRIKIANSVYTANSRSFSFTFFFTFDFPTWFHRDGCSSCPLSFIPRVKPGTTTNDHFRVTLQFPRTITWSRGLVRENTANVWKLQVIVCGNRSVTRKWSIEVTSKMDTRGRFKHLSETVKRNHWMLLLWTELAMILKFCLRANTLFSWGSFKQLLATWSLWLRLEVVGATLGVGFEVRIHSRLRTYPNQSANRRNTASQLAWTWHYFQLSATLSFNRTITYLPYL